MAALYVAFVVVSFRGGTTSWLLEADLALLGFTLHAGFGIDRELAYDQLVTSNWVDPWSYIGAKMASLALSIGGTTVVVGTTVLVASTGAWDQALWHSLLFLLLGAYFLPVVLFVEMGMESRLPLVGAIVLVGTASLVVTAVWGSDAARALFIGSVPRSPEVASLGSLACRALGVSLPAALGILFPVRRRVAGSAR